MSKEEEAVERFKQGYGCAQSVFTVYCPPGVMDEKDALKMSTFLGGGICASGTGPCGAASGALLALSMKHGMSDPNAKEAKEKTYALGQTLLTRFEERLGARTCNGVLGVPNGSPEHKEKAQEIRATRCVAAVRTASQVLEELL